MQSTGQVKDITSLLVETTGCRSRAVVRVGLHRKTLEGVPANAKFRGGVT